jgi:dTDP-4-dehydrorhamnose 3,5-epimerase-like enzyme
MKKFNIYDKDNDGLEVHVDDRGVIADVFFSTNINHVALITSTPNVIRGNHYHKESTQSILIVRGSLEYWYKNANSIEDAKFVIAKVGDVVTSDPSEIHTLRIGVDGCDFLAFTVGKRGGSDYEADTYRVESIIKA